MKIKFGSKQIEIADGVEIEQVLQAVAEEVQAVQDALEESKSKGSKSEDEVVRLQEELKAIKEALEEVQAKALDEEMTDEELEKARKSAEKSMAAAIRAGKKSGATAMDLMVDGVQKAGRAATKSVEGVDNAIQPDFHQEIIKRLRDFSPIIGHFYQMPAMNEDTRLPVRTGGTGAKLGRDFGPGNPDLGYNHGSFLKATAKPTIPFDLINDAFFPIVPFIKETLAEDFSELLGNTLLNGTKADHVDSCDGLFMRFDKVEGAKDLKTRKTDYFAVTDLSAGAMDETLISKLLAVTESLKSGYRTKAKWFMDNDTFVRLSAIHDKMGHPYLKPSALAANEYVLHGKPIVVDSTAKAGSPILYGDMARGVAQLNLGNSFTSRFNEFQLDDAITLPTQMRHGLIVRDNQAVVGVFVPAAA